MALVVELDKGFVGRTTRVEQDVVIQRKI